MNNKERVLAMVAGDPVDRLPLMPITMMFAADQLGIRYRDYANDYRMLVQAQIHTAEAFGFDFVSVISDPAREAGDCGATVQHFDNQPPAIDENNALLADKTKLARLKVPDPLEPGRMMDRVKACDLFHDRVGDEMLVEGWIEGPCAEGADLRGINTLMLDFYDDPAFIRDLFEFNVQMGLRFAQEQVEAGADLIGVGDAAASLVGPEIYEEFVWPAERKLVDGLHAMGAKVRLHICGQITPLLAKIGELECEIVDIDSLVSLAEARRKMGPNQVLLGNLNPVAVLRNGTARGVTDALAQCHQQAGARYVVGAGCEVPRGTPLENLRAMAAYAHGHAP